MAERNRLSDRLKRIREKGCTAPCPGAEPRSGGPSRSFRPPRSGVKTSAPPGAGRYPAVSSGTVVPAAKMPPEWLSVGPFSYRREILVKPSYPGRTPGAESLLCRGLGGNDLVFFDTETTGLSGGAGTHIFLFGTARVVDGGLRLVQVLLTDFPGENEFLHAVRTELDTEAVLVSYNGKGFDSHLLTTRCIMNGIRPVYYDQVDLLYVVRRFWGKMLPACNLSTVEERILGVERGEDIPGYAVPGRYFEFLKNPDYRLISPIVEHNAQDVISLALLFSRIDAILEHPRPDSADPYGLGRFLAERGIPEGEKLLWDEAVRGHPEALKLVTSACKRRGDYLSILPLWENAWYNLGCHFSGLEIAKYLEHRTGDYAAALGVVAQMLARVEPAARAGRELLKRKLRLESKLEREAPGGE